MFNKNKENVMSRKGGFPGGMPGGNMNNMLKQAREKKVTLGNLLNQTFK